MSTIVRYLAMAISAMIILWATFALLRLKTTGTYMIAAAVAQGLSMGPMFKVAVAEYYQDYGHLPESNTEVKLEASEAYAKGALVSAGIGKGGVITFLYNEKSGIKGGRIQLIPHTNEHRGSIRWECVTSSYPTIEKFFPQCHYIKALQGT